MWLATRATAAIKTQIFRTPNEVWVVNHYQNLEPKTQ